MKLSLKFIFKFYSLNKKQSLYTISQQKTLWIVQASSMVKTFLNDSKKLHTSSSVLNSFFLCRHRMLMPFAMVFPSSKVSVNHLALTLFNLSSCLMWFHSSYMSFYLSWAHMQADLVWLVLEMLGKLCTLPRFLTMSLLHITVGSIFTLLNSFLSYVII